MDDRYTGRDEHGAAICTLVGSASSATEIMRFVQRLVDRLAAYEDTGLTPDEVAAMVAAKEVQV